MQKKPAIERTCEQCGKVFGVMPYQVVKEAARFCSRPCYWENKRQPRLPLADRFWSKVDRRSDAECWLWTAYRDPHGYGHMGGASGPNVLAHRVSWELHFGSIPEGRIACHICDNPPCVNPYHLFLGTYQDNADDMVIKGRQARGSRSGAQTHPHRVKRGSALPQSKLTEMDVRQIRQWYGGGKVRMIDLAAHFGVSLTEIHNVIKGKRWGHVPPVNL